MIAFDVSCFVILWGHFLQENKAKRCGLFICLPVVRLFGTPLWNSATQIFHSHWCKHGDWWCRKQGHSSTLHFLALPLTSSFHIVPPMRSKSSNTSTWICQRGNFCHQVPEDCKRVLECIPECIHTNRVHQGCKLVLLNLPMAQGDLRLSARKLPIPSHLTILVWLCRERCYAVLSRKFVHCYRALYWERSFLRKRYRRTECRGRKMGLHLE